MKIIGHRGARGSELENSLASIQKAFEFDIDAIEFDIHLTKDGVLVVMHDATTKRTATESVRIADVTFTELQRLRLQNGQAIPTLEEVLKFAGPRMLYIDIKDHGTAPLLVRLLEQYPAAQIAVVSRLAEELRSIRALRPDIPTYMYFLWAEHPIPRPFQMVQAAQAANATGLGLHKFRINPITYWLANRRGLKLYSYPLSKLAGTRLFHRLYPTADIMTSRPEAVNHQTFDK